MAAVVVDEVAAVLHAAVVVELHAVVAAVHREVPGRVVVEVIAVEDIAVVAAAAAVASAAPLRCHSHQVGHHRSAGQAVVHSQAHGPATETYRLPVVDPRRASALGLARVTLPVDLVVLAHGPVLVLAPTSDRARVPERCRAAQVALQVEICKTSSIFPPAAWRAQVGHRRDP